jgi:hypothetical protein
MTSTRVAVIDCGRFPSDDNCKIKLSAPEDQVDKLMDLAVYHACKNHGQQDSAEFRNQLKGAVEYQDA